MFIGVVARSCTKRSSTGAERPSHPSSVTAILYYAKSAHVDHTSASANAARGGRCELVYLLLVGHALIILHGLKCMVPVHAAGR